MAWKKGKKKPPAYLPRLANPGSDGQTPASLVIDIHYMNLLLVERWTWERYVKLCHFLRMTSHEVASLVRLPHRSLASYQYRNTLPLSVAHAEAVALLLTLLESYLMRGLTEDIIEQPFPNLNQCSGPSTESSSASSPGGTGGG